MTILSFQPAKPSLSKSVQAVITSLSFAKQIIESLPPSLSELKECETAINEAFKVCHALQQTIKLDDTSTAKLQQIS